MVFFIIVAGKPGHDLKGRLDSAMQDVSDKYILLEETEKAAVKNALIEERGRFCVLINCLQPVVVRIHITGGSVKI